MLLEVLEIVGVEKGDGFVIASRRQERAVRREPCALHSGTNIMKARLYHFSHL
jgi:hypothetical protein